MNRLNGVILLILILAVYIALLSLVVNKFAGKKKHRWIYSGYMTAFLLPFLVISIFISIIGPIVGAGIGVAAVGLFFALATGVTGFVYLFIGYTSKDLHDE